LVTGTPVAVLIVVEPGVQIKAIKGHPLRAHPNLGNKWADLGIEPISVHAEVARGVLQANHTRHQDEIPA
jgi:hypothetical protein